MQTSRDTTLIQQCIKNVFNNLNNLTLEQFAQFKDRDSYRFFCDNSVTLVAEVFFKSIQNPHNKFPLPDGNALIITKVNGYKRPNNRNVAEATVYLYAWKGRFAPLALIYPLITRSTEKKAVQDSIERVKRHFSVVQKSFFVLPTNISPYNIYFEINSSGFYIDVTKCQFDGLIVTNKFAMYTESCYSEFLESWKVTPSIGDAKKVFFKKYQPIPEKHTSQIMKCIPEKHNHKCTTFVSSNASGVIYRNDENTMIRITQPISDLTHQAIVKYMLSGSHSIFLPVLVAAEFGTQNVAIDFDMYKSDAHWVPRLTKHVYANVYLTKPENNLGELDTANQMNVLRAQLILYNMYKELREMGLDVNLNMLTAADFDVRVDCGHGLLTHPEYDRDYFFSCMQGNIFTIHLISPFVLVPKTDLMKDEAPSRKHKPFNLVNLDWGKQDVRLNGQGFPN
jgi:hypothetical protein